MNTTAADTGSATDAVHAVLHTGEDTREAERALRTTWTPWPTDATPLTVADALRNARAAGYIPERNPR